MPGFWEMRGPKVLCAILHVETVTLAWSFGFRNLIIPGPVVPLSGMPYDHARNAACMNALECGAEYIFFLDSDVVPPHDAVLRLIARNKPIISGVYSRRSPPVGVPVMLKQGRWCNGKDLIKEVIEVDLVGAGCLLIKREVLESLPPQRPGKHWFDWRVDLAGVQGVVDPLSEDFTFCTHAKRHGYKTYVDTTIRCRHVGHGEADVDKFGPLVCTPMT